MSIVLACNRADANPSPLALRVADIVLADELGAAATELVSGGGSDGDDADDASGPVDRPEQYTGRYHSPELDVDYVLSVEAGVLRLRGGPGLDVELQQTHPDHLEAGWMELRLRRDDGRIEGFEVDAGRVRNLRFDRVGG